MIAVILIIVGMVAGLLGGLMGLGGGILFVPVLLFVHQSAGIPDPVLWTVGTSLLCNFAVGSGSSVNHYRMDNLFLREGIMVGLFGIAGTFAGRWIATAPFYGEQEFTIIYILILLYSMYRFLIKKKISHEKEGPETKGMRWYHGLPVGFAAGALAVLAGVGGGLVLVPGMTIMLSMGFRKAVSISSTAIMVITLSGWIQLALLSPASGGYSGVHLGYVDVGLALPLIAGSLLGVRYGVCLLDVVPLRTLELFFAGVILIVIVRMAWGLF